MSAIASGAINGDMPSDTSPSALPGAPHPASNTNGTSGSPTGRNLIICIDGSGNHYGPPDSNTNVIKLFNLFQQSTATQVCYYQPGIGAGESNGVNRLAVAVQKRVDFAIATHLEVQVTDAYKWLMDTWEDGDRVYMFGFSRGSYICRALAGMLQRVGLLGAGNFQCVRRAASSASFPYPARERGCCGTALIWYARQQRPLRLPHLLQAPLARERRPRPRVQGDVRAARACRVHRGVRHGQQRGPVRAAVAAFHLGEHACEDVPACDCASASPLSFVP